MCGAVTDGVVGSADLSPTHATYIPTNCVEVAECETQLSCSSFTVLTASDIPARSNAAELLPGITLPQVKFCDV